MTNNTDRARVARVARWLGLEQPILQDYDRWKSGEFGIVDLSTKLGRLIFLAAIKAKLKEKKIDWNSWTTFFTWNGEVSQKPHNFGLRNSLHNDEYVHIADTELAAALAAVCVMKKEEG